MDTPSINLDLGGLAQALVSQPAEAQNARTRWTGEEVVPGLVLEDYTHRKPNDEGTYVHVIEHYEHIEKIPQPPTPEELEAQKQKRKDILKVLGGIGVVVIAALGMSSYADSKRPKTVLAPVTPAPAAKSKPKVTVSK